MPAPLGHPVSDIARQKIAEARMVHGHTVCPKGSPERRTFDSWAHMMSRCNRPADKAYPSYGGRGIVIHPDWKDYSNFVRDMGLQPTGMQLDRVDNNGPYEKANCRWASRQDQCRNRRSNRILTIEGESRTLAEWSDLSGLNSSTIRMRIKYRGGLVDRSILEPVSRK